MFSNRLVTVLIIVVMFLTMAACAARRPLSPAEAAYARAVLAQPTIFMLSNEKAVEAWGRGQVFVAQFSNMKIQIATDNVLQTYNPIGGGIKYGYSLTRMPMGDQTQFIVQCVVNNVFSRGNASQNAHALALFMVSGELMPQYIYR